MRDCVQFFPASASSRVPAVHSCFYFQGAPVKTVAILLLCSVALFAQQSPDPAAQARPDQQQKPSTTNPQVSPPPMQTPQPNNAATKDQPLKELPYTPSLDIPSMDKAADPCVDFYQYTCGGWMKNNPIPGDQAAWSVYGKLTVDNQRFLWGILDDLAKKTT